MLKKLEKIYINLKDSYNVPLINNIKYYILLTN